jgi:phage tail sheath gpL-like
MAAIPITGVSSNWLVPDGYVELNFARGPATAAAEDREIVVVGPKTSAGSWTANTLYGPITGEQDAITGAGPGSPVHRCIRKILEANRRARVYVLPYAATSGGTPATATFAVTWTNNPTSTGRTTVWVNGEPVTYDFDANDTVTTIAAGVVAGINAKTWLPVTAANAAGVLTLTAKIAGVSQGDGTVKAIPVRTEITAGGTTVSAGGHVGDTVAGAEGSTTEAANLTTALATLNAVRRYYVAITAQDQSGTALGALKTHITSKSSPNPGLRSVGIGAHQATQALAETRAVTLNEPRVWLLHQTGSDHDPAELVGFYVGLVSQKLSADFTANLNGARLDGINAANAVSDWPDDDDKNDAITDGVTLIASDNSGSYVVKPITTKSKDSTGAVADRRAAGIHKVSGADSFCDQLLATYRARFGGYKLTDDQTDANGNLNPNQRIPRNTVTPSTFKPWILDLYDQWGPNDQAHLQNIEESKSAIRIVRDPSNSERLEVALNIQVVDHLSQATFRVDEVSAG